MKNKNPDDEIDILHILSTELFAKWKVSHSDEHYDEIAHNTAELLINLVRYQLSCESVYLYAYRAMIGSFFEGVLKYVVIKNEICRKALIERLCRDDRKLDRAITDLKDKSIENERVGSLIEHIYKVNSSLLKIFDKYTLEPLIRLIQDHPDALASNKIHSNDALIKLFRTHQHKRNRWLHHKWIMNLTSNVDTKQELEFLMVLLHEQFGLTFERFEQMRKALEQLLDIQLREEDRSTLIVDLGHCLLNSRRWDNTTFDKRLSKTSTYLAIKSTPTPETPNPEVPSISGGVSKKSKLQYWSILFNRWSILFISFSVAFSFYLLDFFHLTRENASYKPVMSCEAISDKIEFLRFELKDSPKPLLNQKDLKIIENFRSVHSEIVRALDSRQRRSLNDCLFENTLKELNDEISKLETCWYIENLAEPRHLTMSIERKWWYFWKAPICQFCYSQYHELESAADPVPQCKKLMSEGKKNVVNYDEKDLLRVSLSCGEDNDYGPPFVAMGFGQESYQRINEIVDFTGISLRLNLDDLQTREECY